MIGNITVVERVCGWCGTTITEDPTEHALVCRLQPYRFFKDQLITELGRKNKTESPHLPKWVIDAIKEATNQTEEYVRTQRWD